MRLYYVTLCGDYRGKYINVYAKSGDEAYRLAVNEYGVLNVCSAYTEKGFEHIKSFVTYFGKLWNPAENDYLRRKKII